LFICQKNNIFVHKYKIHYNFLDAFITLFYTKDNLVIVTHFSNKFITSITFFNIRYFFFLTRICFSFAVWWWWRRGMPTVMLDSIILLHYLCFLLGLVSRPYAVPLLYSLFLRENFVVCFISTWIIFVILKKKIMYIKMKNGFPTFLLFLQLYHSNSIINILYDTRI